MANTGLSSELEELFSSVADELGWRDINEARKGLELELVSQKTTKSKKTKGAKDKKKKAKTTVNKLRRKKKSGGSGDNKSQVAYENKSKDQICCTGGGKLDSTNTSDLSITCIKTCKQKESSPQDEDVIIIDDEEDCKNIVDKVKKGSLEHITEVVESIVPDVSQCSVYLDNDSDVDTGNDGNDIDRSDDKSLESSSPGKSHKVIEDSDIDENGENIDNYHEDTDEDCIARNKSDNANHDNEIQCGTRPDAIATNSLQDVSDDDNDSNKDKDRNAVPGHVSGESPQCNEQNDASVSNPERTPPFLTLTERLMRNRKHKKERKEADNNRCGERRNQDESVRRKEKTGSGVGRVNGIECSHSEDEEEEVSSTCRSKLPSSEKNPGDQTRFSSYRDVETPDKKYASDTSSDEDDNFESFLASIKSSQTPAKLPPTQDDMDDFIADDDEPIEISSEDEDKDQDEELFYYQCDNAEEPIFAYEEEPSGTSTIYQSLLSDSGNSEKENFATPATHPKTSLQNVFKKPKDSTTKPAPHVNSILSDSDDDDSFATPSWQPVTSQKKLNKKADHTLRHWNVKASTKVPIKVTPPSSIVHVFPSDESDGDDSVFATPVVRPPLKTRKPPNTLPTKLSRPAVNSYHKPQGHERRSTPSFLGSLATPYKGESSSSPYVKDFKRKKEELTRKLVKLYNETVFDNKLPSNLSVTWNKRLRKTAGYCYYSKSKVGQNRQSRIELSDKVCDSAERLRDTLIHEMCHAAAWLVNGVHDGHGRYWKYWAAKANIAHPEIPIIKRCHSYEINTKYKYQCVRCKTTYAAELMERVRELAAGVQVKECTETSSSNSIASGQHRPSPASFGGNQYQPGPFQSKLNPTLASGVGMTSQDTTQNQCQLGVFQYKMNTPHQASGVGGSLQGLSQLPVGGTPNSVSANSNSLRMSYENLPQHNYRDRKHGRQEDKFDQDLSMLRRFSDHMIQLLERPVVTLSQPLNILNEASRKINMKVETEFSAKIIIVEEDGEIKRKRDSWTVSIYLGNLKLLTFNGPNEGMFKNDFKNAAADATINMLLNPRSLTINKQKKTSSEGREYNAEVVVEPLPWLKDEPEDYKITYGAKKLKCNPMPPTPKGVKLLSNFVIQKATDSEPAEFRDAKPPTPKGVKLLSNFVIQETSDRHLAEFREAMPPAPKGGDTLSNFVIQETSDREPAEFRDAKPPTPKGVKLLSNFVIQETSDRDPAEFREAMPPAPKGGDTLSNFVIQETSDREPAEFRDAKPPTPKRVKLLSNSVIQETSDRDLAEFRDTMPPAPKGGDTLSNFVIQERSDRVCDYEVDQKAVIPMQDIMHGGQSSNTGVFRASMTRAIPEDNIGYKMLKLLGWSGQGGLGKEGKGISEPIIPVRCKRRYGLGFSKMQSMGMLVEKKKKTKRIRKHRKVVTRMIEEYIATGREGPLVFASTLTKEERKEIHSIAHQFNLKSKSYGKGVGRYIQIARC